MIHEIPNQFRTCLMRRSHIYGDYFPDALPADNLKKRIVFFMTPAAKDVVKTEVDWLKAYTIQQWSRPLMMRLCLVRGWSRK